MISDIEIPEVKNVTLDVTTKKTHGERGQWKVYLINSNNFPIENTLVVGYGRNSPFMTWKYFNHSTILLRLILYIRAKSNS